MQSLSAYIPMDRRQAMARGETLPDRTTGAALFADISGFTPLTKALADELGRKAGAEAVLGYINPVYEALITELHRYGGSVIGFAGDSITCWLDKRQGNAELRAVTCALAMQETMGHFATTHTPGGTPIILGIKVAVAAGPVRRFLVGDPNIKLIDTLAGATLERMAGAEERAMMGEVVVSREVVEALGDGLVVKEWREDDGRFAVVHSLTIPAEPTPWPSIPTGNLSQHAVKAWILPSVYEYLQSGGAFLGDLRPVTPLFLRFGGPDYNKDEQASQKLDTFIRWVQSIVSQYEGNLLQLTIGDKGAFLYIIFGAPLAHEDDNRRALATALALYDPPPELAWVGQVQIGISRGEVWTGRCGATMRHTYGVMGSDVNLSARLMMGAEPGQTLVSGRVGRQFGFRFNHVGDMPYKGFAEAIPTYELVGEQLPGERVFPDVMVGRDAELQRLLDFAQPLFDGQLAGAALIYGQAGIGKSRLSYALRASLGERVTWFTGQADQILRQAFNPFAYWLKRYFDQSLQAPAEENKTRFQERFNRLLGDVSFADLAAELTRTRSFLSALLGLHWPDSLYEQLSAKLRYQNTLFAIKNLLLAESCLQPIVFELEDGHWLDKASLELLTTISRNITGYPLLIVITSRYADDGSRPAFALSPDMPIVSFDLGALSLAALRRKAENILDGPLAAELLDLLRERTQANPFFAQQVLHYFRENDLLAQNQDGVWGLKTTAIPRDIPASINAILVARIDRLAQEIKQVVQTAAVLGREFEVRVLSQVLRAEVWPEIRQAEEEQIWSVLIRLRYLFKHALLRDAAYDMQLRARLRQLHQLAAQALETLYADDLPPHYGDIAYHYETAYRLGLTEVREQAGTYLCQAGEQAAVKYDNNAAVDYYSRAFALTLEEDAEGRFNLLLGREMAYHLLGKREAQAGDLDTLEALTVAWEWPERQAKVARCWARYANAIGDYLHTVEKAQAAVAYARIAGSVSIEIEALLAWGEALSRQGEYVAADQHLGQAFALAETAGRRDLEEAGLRELGGVAWRQGDYIRAWGYYEQSLTICREISNWQAEGSALNNLGVIARGQRDFAEAQGYYEQALTICRKVGNRLGEGRVLGNLGTVQRALGNYAEAQRYYEQSLAIKREINDRGGEAVTLNNLGTILYALGNHNQAEAHLLQALHIERETGNRVEEGWTLNNLGNVAYAQGRYSQAQARFQHALAIRRELGLPHYIAEDLAGLARVALAQGDTTEAMARVEEVLPILEINPALDGAEHPNQVILTCYHVLHACGDAHATDILAGAYARLREQASKISDEALRRSFLEDVPENREIVEAWQATQQHNE